MDGDLICPRCKTTKYRNPYLKLLVNVCGHALCDSCIELLFVKGAAACPECGVVLRRSSFRTQLFEDASVEKEVDIRKRIRKDFSKTEVDFPSLRAFNDYLEEVETIIFNLVNNVEILETNKKIEQYKKENKDQIAKAKTRPRQYILELDEIIQEEKLRHEQRRYEDLAVEKEEKLQRMKAKESLIDELMFSESDAKDILATHKEKVEKDMTASIKSAEAAARKTAAELHKKGISSTTTSTPDTVGLSSFHRTAGPALFSTGISTSRGVSGLHPIPKKEEAALYRFSELRIEIGGPVVPTQEELRLSGNGNTGSLNYLANVKVETLAEKAGGFHASLACRRALQDAYSELTFKPKESGVQYVEGGIESEDLTEEVRMEID